MMKKLLTFNTLTLAAVSIVICCPGLTKAMLPESGSFDIDGTSTPSFDQIPFSGSSMYVYPFAAPDNDLYTGAGSNYNLGTLELTGGSVTFTDSVEKTGNLGIRISSAVSGDQTFQESILTLDFGDDTFDVYLPELTFSWSEDMFLWVAQSGATYYATESQEPGTGRPDMTASDAMLLGDANLARVPEPVTLALFGSGAMILLSRRRR
jgi:hypothetical protein